MRTRLTKQERQLWKYIEKHYKEWEQDRLKTLITSSERK